MSTAINQLSAVDTVSDADQFPIYSASAGDARKVAASVLATYLEGLVTSNDDKVTQYFAPSANAFSVQINSIAPANSNTWLILTPTGTFAAGTIVLPAVASCLDKQELLVNCTQIVTALTVSGNGATVTGAPTTLAANGVFRLRFDRVTLTWYRV